MRWRAERLRCSVGCIARATKIILRNLKSRNRDEEGFHRDPFCCSCLSLGATAKNSESRDRDPNDFQCDSRALFCDPLGIHRSLKTMAGALVSVHRERE